MTDPAPFADAGAFDPAALLRCAAMYAPRDVAIASPQREITYGELLDLFGDRGSTSTPVRLHAGVGLDALLDALKAFASGGCVWSMDTCGAVATVEAVPQPGATAFERIALVRPRDAEGALAWSAEALCYGWGIAAPPARSVGAMTAPAGSPLAWSSVFGVLLGRGRVVVTETPRDAESMAFMAAQGVRQLNLTLADAQALLETPARPEPAFTSVRVWHGASIDGAIWVGLAQRFPCARLERVLLADGGPLTVASADELREHGAGWLGRTVLGTRLTMAPEGALLVSECVFAPHHMTCTDGRPVLGERWRRTGLRWRTSPARRTTTWSLADA